MDAEQRIKEAFPEMQPSAGHDYVQELIGLLRVARMHIKDAEDRCERAYKRIEQLENCFKRDGFTHLPQKP